MRFVCSREGCPIAAVRTSSGRSGHSLSWQTESFCPDGGRADECKHFLEAQRQALSEQARRRLERGQQQARSRVAGLPRTEDD